MEKENSTNQPQNEVKNGENTCFTDTGSTILPKNEANSSANSVENGANKEFLSKTEENSLKTQENQENQPFSVQNPPVLAKNNVKVQENARFSQENGVVNQSGAPLSQENELDLLSANNINNFNKDFPGVDIEKVRTNQGFSALLSAIMHNPSLSSVYSCFNSIVEAAEESSRVKILHALANLDASVGSLSSSQPSDSGYFTREQVMKMSREEVKQNLDKIRASQSNW